MTDTIDNPGVKFPPPTRFLLGLAISWVLENKVARIRLIGGSASPDMIQVVGAVLVILGLALIFWGLWTFWRVKTGIIPMKPATQIVDHGPYSLSRNPMYAGMATAYFGGVLILNSGWMLLTLPLVMLALFHLVIKREERYLSSAFPEEYARYCSKVRRWL